MVSKLRIIWKQTVAVQADSDVSSSDVAAVCRRWFVILLLAQEVVRRCALLWNNWKLAQPFRRWQSQASYQRRAYPMTTSSQCYCWWHIHV